MKTHGMRKTQEYKAWSEAKQRCHNPKSSKYKWYGARGISVCDEWKNDFEAFFSHVGPKPSEKHELDRIDNDKGYEPGNVHWVTKQDNVRNRRNTVKVVVGGKEMTLDDYAKAAGIPYATAWARLKKQPHLIKGEPKRSGGRNSVRTLESTRRIEAKTI